MKRPSLLVVHPWMARGGSEATLVVTRVAGAQVVLVVESA